MRVLWSSLRSLPVLTDHESCEFFDRFQRAPSSEDNGCIYLCTDFAVRGLEIGRVEQICGLSTKQERTDRVALLPHLDLGLVTVEVRVVHRMRAEAIGP